MSADLFAEFNDPPPSSAPQQSQSQSQSQSQPNIAGQQLGQSQSPTAHQRQTSYPDPFGFSQGGNAFSGLASQPSQQWPNLQNQGFGGMSGWGMPTGTAPQSHVSNSTQGQGEDEDEGWGDFEVAEPTQMPGLSAAAPPPAQAPSIPPQWPSQKVSWQSSTPTQKEDPPITNRVVRASTLDLISNNLVDIGISSRPEPAKSAQSPGPAWGTQPPPHLKKSKAVPKPGPKDPSVLFDADDFELQEGDVDEDEDEDDDDFGNFETATPDVPTPKPPVQEFKQPPPPSSSFDLLSLDDSFSFSAPQEEKEIYISNQPRGALSFGASAANSSNEEPPPRSGQKQTQSSTLQTSTTPTFTSPKKVVKSISPTRHQSVEKKPATVPDANDDWAAWDDFRDDAPAKKQDIDASEPPETWDWGTTDASTPAAAKMSEDIPPPVNVPPPSVILSSFPELLNTGNSLLKPISGQSASIKDRVLSNPRAAEFLQGYILIAMTAARVIAGRKHRWHRDKILAKSMSISAAGSKGMKLAGVDKTQSVREDREAADVAAAWKDHVGRLRSAVAAANAAGKTNLKVPELSENMLVQTAKMVPTAPKPCVICGLKREERVSKVDYDVEDSFGEWWVEHWGHRACKNFWIEHEQKLRQR